MVLHACSKRGLTVSLTEVTCLTFGLGHHLGCGEGEALPALKIGHGEGEALPAMKIGQEAGVNIW